MRPAALGFAPGSLLAGAFQSPDLAPRHRARGKAGHLFRLRFAYGGRSCRYAFSFSGRFGLRFHDRDRDIGLVGIGFDSVNIGAVSLSSVSLSSGSLCSVSLSTGRPGLWPLASRLLARGFQQGREGALIETWREDRKSTR